MHVQASARGGSVKVSAIITAYNYGQFVEEAVESVLSQTTTADLQILVIDDGSTDDTPDVLARIRDPRIEIVRTSNQGISSARNEGLARANGDFVAFLDGDDRWTPNKLTYQLDVMRAEPDMAAVFSNFVRFNEYGEYPRDQFSFFPELALLPTKPTMDGRGNRLLGNPFCMLVSFAEFPVWVQTILFRRQALKDLLFPLSGLVCNDKGNGVCGDITFCLSAYRNGAVGFLTEPLTAVRRHGENATNRLAIMPHAKLAALQLLANLPLSDPERRALNRRIGKALISSGMQETLGGQTLPGAKRYLQALDFDGARLSAIKNLAMLAVPRRPSTNVA
jgi:glycosyltransferase involved in cell wall biosynthesis